jgi:hypothetical protein
LILTPIHEEMTLLSADNEMEGKNFENTSWYIQISSDLDIIIYYSFMMIASWWMQRCAYECSAFV